MNTIKSNLKNLFVRTNTLFILDKLNFLSSVIKNLSMNRRFKKLNPEFVLPSDYYLHETYSLNYKNYKDSGEEVAKEILDWTSVYLKKTDNILEWGCGVARILRHVPKLVDKGTQIYGIDINEKMIKWDAENISDVQFSKSDYYPPTDFVDAKFDLIFAISVFTHIESDLQEKWFQEIMRITRQNGIFLFTTHGKKHEQNLLSKEQNLINENGALTINYKQKGHRMMGTYNRYENLNEIIKKYFDVLEYYDGEKYPEKVGGQDLWIVRKR